MTNDHVQDGFVPGRSLQYDPGLVRGLNQSDLGVECSALGLTIEEYGMLAVTYRQLTWPACVLAVTVLDNTSTQGDYNGALEWLDSMRGTLAYNDLAQSVRTELLSLGLQWGMTATVTDVELTLTYAMGLLHSFDLVERMRQAVAAKRPNA